MVGVTAMLIAISLGTLIGAAAGFFGGLVDQILMRICDLFLSLPQLPLLILTVYLFREPVTKALGPETGIFAIVVTMIGSLAWMQTSRIVRSSFLSLKEKEFVEAANCVGVPKWAIMFRHILPNAISPIIVAATLEIGNAIISESTLSFLGIGFSPDTPTWGRLVTDGSQFLQAAPHLALMPGALIFITVLSINFMGDGLRDALDPRSRL
jgi:peptide/nickel transport system permease protein